MYIVGDTSHSATETQRETVKGTTQGSPRNQPYEDGGKKLHLVARI